jgi:hypothetical protein
MHDEEDEEDMDGKAEPTGRKKSRNSNEHVEGKSPPPIATKWYKILKINNTKEAQNGCWLIG